MVRIIVVVVVLCLTALSVCGDEVNLQRGVSIYGSTEGAWLVEGISDWGFGKAGIYGVNNADTVKRETFILRWDSLSNAIPGGVVITHAELKLKTFMPSTGHPLLAWSSCESLFVAPIEQDWLFADSSAWHGNDGGPTWTGRDTAWNIVGEEYSFKGGKQWTTPGVYPLSADSNVGATEIGSESNKWYTITLDPDVVQRYIDGDNYGLVCYMGQTEDAWEDGDAHRRCFYSPYHDTVAWRPILILEYYMPGAMKGVTISGATKQ